MTPTKEEIKKWLKAIGKDRFWLAERCDSTKRTVDDWLSTSREIPAKAILQIQKLMTGEDKAAPRVVIDFTEEEWAVICDAAKAHRETFLEFLNTALQRAAEEESAPAEAPTPLLFPAEIIGNIAAGALEPGDTIPTTVRIYRALKRDEYLLRVSGKSMEPVIPDGSVIIMRKYTIPPIPKPGSIVQYHDERGVTLKKLIKSGEDYLLHPLNPDFGDIQPMDGGKISALYIETLDSYQKC